MTAWIRAPAEWDGRLPGALVMKVAGPGERRAALRDLGARAMGLAPARVEIVHEAGRAPRLGVPSDAVLHLSSASRGGWAALAVAARPVGIDVEKVAACDEPPWLVLHPEEAASLRALADLARARAFARLWTVKEAYLKSLGLGFAREPASFAVRLLDPERAVIRDPLVPGRERLAESRWIADNAVASVVFVGDP